MCETFGQNLRRSIFERFHLFMNCWYMFFHVILDQKLNVSDTFGQDPWCSWQKKSYLRFRITKSETFYSYLILFCLLLLIKGPLKVLNGTKLILEVDDLRNNLDSFRISLDFTSFIRGPLIHKPVTGQELFFTTSYGKPALI